MTEEKIERRQCKRFVITGATLHYREESFFRRSNFGRDCYPLIDISRGGLRFLSNDRIAVGRKVSVKIVQPDEEPLVMQGTVVWCGLHGGKSYRCEVGIQFVPYGEKENFNAPESLQRISSWEERSARNSDNPKNMGSHREQ